MKNHNTRINAACKFLGKLVNFVRVLIVEHMVSNTRQFFFKGGDVCRFVFFDSAVLSALQWNIIETAVHSKLQAIYRVN